MANINENFSKLPGNYLFADIAKRVAAFQEQNPEVELIKMGIGDVTRPLAGSVIDAMHKAVDEMSCAETFRGYGPEQGYDFLREAICEHDFKARGIDISADEIFISDGAKSDCGNIGDLFAINNNIAVCDPVYPVYVDTNAMAGRAGDWDTSTSSWTNLHYMPTIAENNFCPEIPNSNSSSAALDIIYLCSPNNPTGTALNKDQLKAWVNYANEHDSIIMFDAAYERFISEPDIPHSIFEIEGAKTCAIEFRSFSKTAGFTGMRCGYTIISKELIRDWQSLHDMWLRRQCTKFNGASYIIQKGAAAIYTPQGKTEVDENIAYYKNNALTLKNALEECGYKVYGAINSPYVWCKTPDNMPSWDFFNKLLQECGIVTTPGAGFGTSGEGYIRLTGFSTKENTEQAVERIKKL